MKYFKKENVRHPTGFEFSGAVNAVVLHLMQGGHIREYDDQSLEEKPIYAELEQFFQGPFCRALTSILNTKVSNKGEHVDWSDKVLLIRKD